LIKRRFGPVLLKRLITQLDMCGLFEKRKKNTSDLEAVKCVQALLLCIDLEFTDFGR